MNYSKRFVVLVVILVLLAVIVSGFFIFDSKPESAVLPLPTSTTRINQATKIPASTSSQQVTTTPTAIANPYFPYTGTLSINDPLKDNSAGYNWMDYTTDPSPATQGCQFSGGKYHVTVDANTQSYMVYCLALSTNFSNFACQIDATLLKGNEIGIVFRQTPGFHYYYFSIRRDGSYYLYWNSGSQYKLLRSGVSSAIKTGLNEPNLLAVVAIDNRLDLYVNRQHLATVIDNTYAAGRIGTAVGIPDGSATDSSFSNLMVWTLN